MPLRTVKLPGRDSWYIRGTIAGRRISRSAKTDQRELAELQRIKLEQELTHQEVFGKRETITFSKAVTRYLKRGGSPRFLDPINERIGTMRLTSLDQQIIDDLGDLVYPNASPATLRRQWHGPIIAVMNSVKHPHALERPQASKPKVHWITPETADQIHDCLAPHLLPVWEFLLGTGCRASEAARAKWSNLDLDGAQFVVMESKAGYTRKIDLPQRTVAALSAHPRGNDPFLFHTPKNEPYTVTEGSGGLFNDGIATACRKAGVERITAHVLRHSWATWFYADTKDYLKLRSMGGWRSDKMAEVYTHLATRGLSQRLRAYGWDFTWEPDLENIGETADPLVNQF